MSLCDLGQHPDLPEAGQGVCCIGASVYGPERCTCWEPRYDRDQAEPQPGRPEPRPLMCGDCAYRPASPERLGEHGYAGDADGLEDHAASERPFYCHDGMRHIAQLVHPAGVTIAGHPASYAPPIVDGVPYRADGRPGLICAGWAARHRALTHDERTPDEREHGHDRGRQAQPRHPGRQAPQDHEEEVTSAAPGRATE